MNLGLETGTAAPALIAALESPARAARLWAERSLPKGAVCFHPGDVSSDVFLLLAGLVKLTYTTQTGDEWIKSFVIDQGVFSAIGDGAPATGATYGATCLEPCRFIRLPRAFVEQTVAQDDAARSAYAGFSAWVLARKQAREAALLTLDAEARYRALLAHAPLVLARLPQGDIARFLGITPIAFSRIKRRVAQTGSISPSARLA